MKNKFSHFLFLILVLCLFNSCKRLLEEPDIQYQYSVPELLNDGLATADANSEGLKKEYLVQMTNQINVDAFKNIHSMVIVKNDKLVYENYFNGYDREMLHNLYSASKSFTSALVGAAIDKGFIPDTNVKVLSYFPEYVPFGNDSPQKQDIRLHHLLTMSSGLACHDWDPASPGGEEKLYKKEDLLKFLFDLPMTDPPGANPRYCSGGVIALSNMISKTTGQTYTDFAKSAILDPLGITHYKWNYREKNRTDRPDQIFLRPRDMAKFGMLFLNNGQWQNKQVLSSQWVATSFQTKVKLREIEYGFLWWIRKGTVKGVETKIYTASGNGGQFIFIIPSMNMVVAMTGGSLDSGYTNQGFSILHNYIIPANF